VRRRKLRPIQDLLLAGAVRKPGSMRGMPVSGNPDNSGNLLLVWTMHFRWVLIVVLFQFGGKYVKFLGASYK
jgi:hypothetical protein